MRPAAARTSHPSPARGRPSLLAVALALLVAVVASPAAARAAGPDPIARGPYATQKIEYEAGTLLLKLPDPGQTVSVPMRGSIVRPVRVDPSRVIVFVHGRHEVCIGDPPADGSPCPDSTDPDGTPTSTDIRSYEGYDYLSDQLASHGYTVMSIEANITNFDNGFDDAGADTRSQIIQASLDLLKRWNNGKGPVTDDPDTTVGTKLVGKLELAEGIGLMGHSRGGDAVTDFVTYDRNLTDDQTLLSAVLALAPTAYTQAGLHADDPGDPDGPPRTPEGVTFGTLLPACDGDVSNLQGARFFENAKYAAGNAGVAEVQWYVQGANHNFFNTVWTDDDAGDPSDAACARGSSTSARLSPSDQRRVGVGIMGAFLRRYVGDETAFDPVMTGAVTLPGAAAPTESGLPVGQMVKTSFVGPAAARLDVLRPTPLPDRDDTSGEPADARATKVDAAGGPITTDGVNRFRVCRPGGQPPYPDCPAGSTPSGTYVENESIGTQFNVEWTRPATITAALGAAGATRDVSGYGVLDLRAATNRASARNPAGDGFNPTAATQDFDVTLVDAAGRTASTNAARWTTSLQPSIGTNYGHVVLNGVRIPMTAFPGVDLKRIASVRLGFGTRTPSGSIELGDVMFQERATPVAVTPTIPAPNGPASPQGTIVGPPAQVGTGATTPATTAGGSGAACADTIAPTTRRALTRLRRSRILVVGVAADRGCAGARGRAGGGVRRTAVRIYRRVARGRCRFVTARGRLTKPARCGQPVLVYARGARRWRLSIRRARLPRGAYHVGIETYDRSGNAKALGTRVVRVR